MVYVKIDKVGTKSKAINRDIVFYSEPEIRRKFVIDEISLSGRLIIVIIVIVH